MTALDTGFQIKTPTSPPPKRRRYKGKAFPEASDNISLFLDSGLRRNDG
jgi:hypothetical protein